MPEANPRLRLLDAVVDHALAAGVADKSLRAIAAATGTSHRMLIHHFGSREALLVEVTRAVEERQRSLLAEAVEDSRGDLLEAGRRLWSRLCDPALAPQERTFFELYGQALQGRSFAKGLLDGVIDDWVGPLVGVLVAAGVPSDIVRVDARLLVAVTRGLLLDLLATGDRDAVDAAMARFSALYEDALPNPNV